MSLEHPVIACVIDVYARRRFCNPFGRAEVSCSFLSVVQCWVNLSAHSQGVYLAKRSIRECLRGSRGGGALHKWQNSRYSCKFRSTKAALF
jgi:hypothetical protein